MDDQSRKILCILSKKPKHILFYPFQKASFAKLSLQCSYAPHNLQETGVIFRGYHLYNIQLYIYDCSSSACSVAKNMVLCIVSHMAQFIFGNESVEFFAGFVFPCTEEMWTSVKHLSILHCINYYLE